MNHSDQDDCRLLLRIGLENLLSFGPGGAKLELANLNVLIGPNAAGKSNLIEALSLLRAAPISATVSNMDLRGIVRHGGGVNEWVWKGGRGMPASIDVVVNYPKGKQPLRHLLSFRDEQGFLLEDERIEDETLYPGESDAHFYYRFQDGQPVVNSLGAPMRRLARETVNTERSILAQRRDPELYPEIARLADAYEKIRIYREWAFGRNTVFREPQRADMRSDRLEEDFSNLGLVLSRLRKTPKAKTAIWTA